MKWKDWLTEGEERYFSKAILSKLMHEPHAHYEVIFLFCNHSREKLSTWFFGKGWEGGSILGTIKVYYS